MTERGSGALQQAEDRLAIGPSTLRTTGEGLVIDIDERATPFAQRVIGQVEVAFDQSTPSCFELDAEGDHWWWPIAPISRINVAMDRPDFSWCGSAYVDSNYGARPLETGFASWNWCRGHGPAKDCQIHYDAQLKDGGEKRLSLSIEKSGHMTRIKSPGLQHLPKGRLWRVARPVRIAGQAIGSVKTLEDTPFYTRSQILTEAGSFMHESLDLTRFCQPWVQLLLPFRMPRMG
jgi:carotenoid 1,2-hydratase